MWHLSWICTVCLCPTKSMLGLYGFNLTSYMGLITWHNIRNEISKRRALVCDVFPGSLLPCLSFILNLTSIPYTCVTWHNIRNEISKRRALVSDVFPGSLLPCSSIILNLTSIPYTCVTWHNIRNEISKRSALVCDVFPGSLLPCLANSLILKHSIVPLYSDGFSHTHWYNKFCLIWFFAFHQQSFSYVGMGLTGFNQY